MFEIFKELEKVRYDDHVNYHNSIVNRKLHFVSGFTFIICYMLIYNHFTLSVYLAWLIAMPLRQIGHFIYEPSSEGTENIKSGYNIKRKIVLHSIVYVTPICLYQIGMYSVGFLALIWFFFAINAIVFRGIYLIFKVNKIHGFAWMLKVVSDPFHDVYLYHDALLKKL